jgi:hypothetical protein
MMAEVRVDVAVGKEIDEHRYTSAWRQTRWGLSIPFREKMEDSVDIGGITDVTEFEFKI